MRNSGTGTMRPSGQTLLGHKKSKAARTKYRSGSSGQKRPIVYLKQFMILDEEFNADATGGITAEIVKATDDDETSLPKEVSYTHEP